MKTIVLIASGICLAALAITAASVPAQALSMKECSAKYKAAKTAGTLNGMKWKDFRKSECGGAAPAAATKPETKPETKAETKKETKPAPSGSPGREAMVKRERACGAEWKADKAAGKIAAGMKWPQYWSACDKRKKAQGM